MIAKGDKSLPDDEEGQRIDPASAGSSPAHPGEVREGGLVEEYPIPPRQELAMYGKAISRRYRTSRRMRKRMVARIEELIDSPDDSIALQAIGKGIEMEKVNQKDEQPQVTVNGPTVIQIVKREDWYGNRAHDLAAQRVAAPEAGAALPCAVQAGGERPTVGKNGNGTAHHN